ncbi:hypothetical protein PC121_g20968 [Phytophthora cactorum]|nr:hypothetical protein PC121_g20968 [Phytophthora cactorum]
MFCVRLLGLKSTVINAKQVVERCYKTPSQNPRRLLLRNLAPVLAQRYLAAAVNGEGGIRAHWPGAGSTKEKTRSGNDGGEDDDAAQPSHKRRRVTATI